MSRWRPEARTLLLPDDVGSAEVATAFAQLIDVQCAPRGTRLTCIVPVPFVRYVLVPWSAALQSRKTQQILAEHCLRQTYGELVREWVVRVDRGQFGRAVLACAMSAVMLADLERVATQHGMVLVSVQPALMNAINALQAPLGRKSTWIVVPSQSALTLLLVEGDRPVRVTVVAGTIDQSDALLRREWFALGRDDPWSHTLVCAPAPTQALKAKPLPTPRPAALAV